MRHVLYEYEMHPTTWVYLSSLLMIAIYFKFSRFWSVRNLDLIGLIALAPGLLLVKKGLDLTAAGTVAFGENLTQAGYVWLFVIGGFFLLRMLIDPMMVRRPLLDPNLSPGGLTFIGASLLVFLMMNVVTSEPNANDMEGPRRLEQILEGENAAPQALADADSAEADTEEAPARPQTASANHGPGYPLMHIIASVLTRSVITPDDDANEQDYRTRLHIATARTMAIMSHLAVVIGMVLIGAWHFESLRTGIAAATLYLLLPYTAQMTGHVDHVLPAALLVWMVVAYRKPFIAGMLLGLAGGLISYPIFLLPLWSSFYWQRGLRRFLIGFALTFLALIFSLVLTSSDMASFLLQVKQMFGLTRLIDDNLTGFWGYHPALAPYRIPVMAGFVALAGSFALWPTHKNLGTLLSCSAALMLGSQFWHAHGPHGGGLYVAWYLPLMLLTILRPNLEDRVAIATLGESWFARRRSQGAVKAA